MIRQKIITDVATEPVTLSDAKDFLRIDGTDDDDVLTSLIAVARTYVEDASGHSLAAKTVEIAIDAFPAHDFIALSGPPVTSVTSVKYYAQDDTESTFSSSAYTLDDYGVQHRIRLNYGYTWPITTLRDVNGVLVRYVCGYDSSTLPANMLHAVKLLISHWYETRCMTGKVTDEVSLTVTSLISQRRIIPV